MGKEFLKWMAGGAASILLAVVDYFASGGPIDIKVVGSILLGAVAFRVGGFLVWYFGPKPAA